MAIKKSVIKKNFISNYLESSPEIAIGSVFVFGCVSATTFWLFYFNSKIENINERYEDKIINLSSAYEQRIDIEVIKARQEERDRGSLTIDENSKLGVLLKSTINKIKKENKNEK